MKQSLNSISYFRIQRLQLTFGISQLSEKENGIPFVKDQEIKITLKILIISNYYSSKPTYQSTKLEILIFPCCEYWRLWI